MGDALDPKLIRQMIRPMERDEWKPLLREHQKFVRSSRFGRWQILTVAGLPMPFWQGDAGDGQIALSMIDVRKLDFKFAKLTRAALVGILGENHSFRGINLVNGLVTDSFLDGADFSMGRLEDVDFSRSSLRGAKFNKANLIGADFENCDLTGADFTGAKLSRAKFLNAILDEVKGFAHPIYLGNPTVELAQILEHFEGWVVSSEFEQFVKRHDESILIKGLCAALKTHPEKFGGDNDLWQPLSAKSAAVHFGADDFHRLVVAVATGAPDGRIIKSWGSIGLWGEGDIPGCPYGLVSILKNKDALDDALFFSEFIPLLESVVEPYRSGLTSVLSELGRLA